VTEHTLRQRLKALAGGLDATRVFEKLAALHCWMCACPPPTAGNCCWFEEPNRIGM